MEDTEGADSVVVMEESVEDTEDTEDMEDGLEVDSAVVTEEDMEAVGKVVRILIQNKNLIKLKNYIFRTIFFSHIRLFFNKVLFVSGGGGWW